VLIRFSFLILFIFNLGCDLPTENKLKSQIWEVSFKSVVSVLPTWPGYEKPGFGSPSGVAPAGTGFYFNFKKNHDLSEYILTAFHVIKKASKIEVEDYQGKIDIAQVVYKDEKTDIAILKTITQKKPIEFANTNLLIGDDICVVGNSFGLGPSLTCGVISALNRKKLGFNKIENFIQTDAAVNPGDSGAPLLDNKGKLIGMIDAIYTKKADIDAGVNFAIDKSLIKKVLNKIKID